jgi:hypothetical protein
MIDDERGPPDREIDKIQAIRHLLHSSIRLLFWEEDPFAIHLICQSCDKLIIDCLEADVIQSPVNFADHVKPEILQAFYRIHRETYNYFKHAKEDRHKNLGVRNIVKNNEIAIFLNVARLHYLKRSFYTVHMRYYLGYTNIIMLGFFKDERMNKIHLENEATLNAMTRSQILEFIRSQALQDREFIAEKNVDNFDTLALSAVKIKDYKKALR